MVLMKVSLFHYFVFLKFVCLFISSLAEAKYNVSSEAYIDDNGKVTLSGDFINFVKDMGNFVYHLPENKAKLKKIQRNSTAVVATKPKIKLKSNIQDMKMSTSIKDLLMMKLVSYYEDKYKLSRRPSSTTEVTYHNFFKPRTNMKNHYNQNIITDDISKYMGYKDEEGSAIVVI